MQKYLKVMSLSAEYVGVKPSPAVQLHWFPGKKDASAHFTREEKGCVDRLRERGECVRPPLVASPPHRIPAFRTHNLGMSGTTLTLDVQKKFKFYYMRESFCGRVLLAAYGEQKCRARDVVPVRCSEFGESASRGFIMYYF